MSGKTYVGDYGTIITLDTGHDLADATAVAIVAKMPNGNEVTWPGTVDGTNVRYVTQFDQVNANGTWKLQAKVTTPDGEWFGETVPWPVFSKFY